MQTIDIRSLHTLTAKHQWWALEENRIAENDQIMHLSRSGKNTPLFLHPPH